MLEIAQDISIPISEIEFSAIRAGGPGGQNVNKVSSAIHLRFDIPGSSLPEQTKTALLKIRDRRLTSDGVVVIKAQRYRDQEKNRQDALLRLQTLLQQALHKKPKRLPTKPSRAAKRRRVDAKTRRGQIKAMRGKVRGEAG